MRTFLTEEQSLCVLAIMMVEMAFALVLAVAVVILYRPKSEGFMTTESVKSKCVGCGSKIGCDCVSNHRESIAFATRAIQGVAKDPKVSRDRRAKSLRKLIAVIRQAAEDNGIDQTELEDQEGFILMSKVNIAQEN